MPWTSFFGSRRLRASPGLRALNKFFGSRRLRASPSLRALNKFFGSRRLRASPQGSSPWTSLVAVLRHPSLIVLYLTWAHCRKPKCVPLGEDLGLHFRVATASLRERGGRPRWGEWVPSGERLQLSR